MTSKIFLGLIGVFVLALGTNSITVQEAESQPLKGYVLTNNQGQVVPKSGVRIGPLDLAYEKNIQKYNFSPDIVQKIQPYVGKTGNEAKQVIEKQPLALTQGEYDEVSNKFIEYWTKMYQRAPRSLKSNPRIQSLFKLAEQRKWPEFLANVDQIRSQFI